jgi:hypothetical protein
MRRLGPAMKIGMNLRFDPADCMFYLFNENLLLLVVL